MYVDFNFLVSMFPCWPPPIAGVFTVPRAGLWRVSFSMESGVYTGQRNYAYIYHNNQRMEETQHWTYYGGGGHIDYTGGREVMVRAQQGDTLHLGTTTVEYYFRYIIVCFEFLNF